MTGIVCFIFDVSRTQDPQSRWVADPLLPGDGGGGAFPIAGGVTQSVWISVDVPKNLAATTYTGSVTWTLTSASQPVRCETAMNIIFWLL